jgi:tetratricopeptide (TPR) repeat protein
MARQQYQPALAAYDEAWQREPSSILVVKKFQAKRQVTPGGSAYEIPLRWLKDHPDDNQVTTAIAAGYQEDGLLDKAVPYYEKCLELQPDNLLALNNLAWIYSVQGNERAISLAERAYQLRPDSAGIIDTYGWVLLQSGESKKALALLSESVQKLPDVPEAVYHHAVALHKNGDKRTATTILEKLLASKKPFDGREDALKLVNGQ